MMKARHDIVILFLVFFTMQVTGRFSAYLGNSKLLEHSDISHDPSKALLVIVNAKALEQNARNPDYDITGENKWKNDDSVFENEAKEEAKYLLYDYLLRSGEPQNIEEEIEEQKKTALRAVLKIRCEAVVKCKKKCEKTKSKKKKYCPQNCKAIFDKLDLCDPPKKKKKDSCEEDSDECIKSSSEKDECDKSSDSDQCKRKKGRTMPPKWRL